MKLIKLLKLPILCFMLCVAWICPADADDDSDVPAVAIAAGAVASGVAIAIGR